MTSREKFAKNLTNYLFIQDVIVDISHHRTIIGMKKLFPRNLKMAN
jgi:hypothetical protein